MKIVDENGTILENPDLKKGYLRPEKRFLAHHEALPFIEEVSHLVTLAEYANGGKDVERVIDTPRQEAMDAWDEYEDVMRYVLYTPEQLSERNKPSDMQILKGIVSALAMVTGHSEVLKNVKF